MLPKTQDSPHFTIVITGQINPPYASRETQTCVIEAASTQEAKAIAKARFKENFTRAAGICAQVK